jgi:hypothetical protein
LARETTINIPRLLNPAAFSPTVKAVYCSDNSVRLELEKTSLSEDVPNNTLTLAQDACKKEDGVRALKMVTSSSLYTSLPYKMRT